MDERRVVDIVRDVVRDLDPGQLSDFDFLAEAYRRNPAAARRAGRGGAEPTGNGWVEAGKVLATLVMAVGVDLTKDAVIGGGKSLWGKLFGPKAGLDSVAPELPVDRKAEFAAKARDLALAHGASDAEADGIAAALVERWNPKN